MKLETQQCYNPFILNNRAISNIVFFNKDGQICETHSGWFGHSNNKFKELEVGDLVMSRSNTLDKNLAKCKSTYITATSSYDKTYILYLYVDGENIKQVSAENKTNSWNDTEVRHYKDYVFEIFGNTVQFDETIKFEKTNFGQKVDETFEKLEELSINIDRYTLQRLLKNFDLVQK